MALFALMCFDKPDSLALRMANRDDHLAYAREHMSMIALRALSLMTPATWRVRCS